MTRPQYGKLTLSPPIAAPTPFVADGVGPVCVAVDPAPPPPEPPWPVTIGVGVVAPPPPPIAVVIAAPPPPSVAVSQNPNRGLISDTIAVSLAVAHA